LTTAVFVLSGTMGRARQPPPDARLRNPIPDRVYHRGDILKLALYRIGVGIAARAASTPVNSIYAKVLLERRKNGFPALG
jgi:hypothetical protein